MNQTSHDSFSDTLTQEPTMFEVVMLNDNYTAMDFVVDVLIRVFGKSAEDAISIMLTIHKENVGVCGVYPYDIAELKIKITHEMAKERGYPLRLECRSVE